MKKYLIPVLILILLCGCQNKQTKETSHSQETTASSEVLLKNEESNTTVITETTIINTTVATTKFTSTTKFKETAVFLESATKRSTTTATAIDFDIQISEYDSPEMVDTPLYAPQPSDPNQTNPNYLDNTKRKSDLEFKIKMCQSNIEYYQRSIVNKQNSIESYQEILNIEIPRLESAQRELNRVMEDKIRVYSESQGWHYEVDAEALRNAEIAVDSIQNSIDDCNETIYRLNTEIEELRNKISNSQNEMATYQSELNSLS